TPPGVAAEGSTEQATQTQATVAHPYDAQEWRGRLAQIVAEATQRPARTKALRAGLNARRAAGKAIQHGRRVRGRPRPTTPTGTTCSAATTAADSPRSTRAGRPTSRSTSCPTANASTSPRCTARPTAAG